MLAGARVLRLGFLGDFLSASVLIGFLTGVGISVLTGQLPAMLGIAKPSGNWFHQQWHLLTSLPDASLTTVAFAAGTLAVIVAFRLFLPSVPGSIIAVVIAIAVSAAVDAGAHGVALVGSVHGGFPPIGLPKGVTWSDTAHVVGIAFSCFVLIIAQSAATSRSFAMRRGERVDVNRDIVGLSAANLAAGVTGTFVVNGSPTKTQILDEQKGRTQLANITMSAIVLLIVLFASAVLKDMPEAVLAAIVFLIGIDLVDVAGLRRLWRQQRGEFVIAAVTGICVFAVGVEQGILVAVTLSILNLVRRQYRPSDFVVGVDDAGTPTYRTARPGMQSLPGLLVFRYDADLFYANANRFVDEVQELLAQTPVPCRWLVLDASSIDDIDYSAALSLATLIDFVRAHGARFVLAAADSRLVATLDGFDLLAKIGAVNMQPTVADAVIAFRRSEQARQ
jgi:MFS superfamily sulfate permease-like transporter